MVRERIVRPIPGGRRNCSCGVPISKTVILCVFLTLPLLVVSAGDAAATTAEGESVGRVSELWAEFRVWLAVKFAETPAIVLGVAMALAIPPLAILGSFLRRGPGDKAVEFDDVPRSVPARGWQIEGSLIEAENGGDRHTIGHGLVRIGREDDNDVQLVHNTVHRYHAIIERTPEAEFVVMDVSGTGGNGVRINGERVAHCRLRGGELIEIGMVQLRFQLSEV